jgi:hypothetical protein
VSPLAVVELPTTCPLALIPVALLQQPPSVPKSVMMPPEYRKAWFTEPSAELEEPTTSPLSLIAAAPL